MSDSTQRFSERAGAYAAHRPGYAPEVIDAMLAGLGDPGALIAADVGAGTGISARALADRGLQVIALEPNAAMRAAAQPHPRIEWREATALATGLPDKSVDLAAAFQAFHWFANAEAMQELARIARRRVAIAQYERDERDPVTRTLSELYRRYATDDTEARRLAALETFAAFPGAQVRRATFYWEQSLDLRELLGTIASASYLPREGTPSENLRADACALFAANQHDGRLTIARQTFVACADL